MTSTSDVRLPTVYTNRCSVYDQSVAGTLFTLSSKPTDPIKRSAPHQPIKRSSPHQPIRQIRQSAGQPSLPNVAICEFALPVSLLTERFTQSALFFYSQHDRETWMLYQNPENYESAMCYQCEQNSPELNIWVTWWRKRETSYCRALLVSVSISMFSSLAL